MPRKFKQEFRSAFADILEIESEVMMKLELTQEQKAKIREQRKLALEHRIKKLRRSKRVDITLHVLVTFVF